MFTLLGNKKLFYFVGKILLLFLHCLHTYILFIPIVLICKHIVIKKIRRILHENVDTILK